MKKRIEKRNRQTLLSVYEEDLRSLESRIGKDRSASTWKAMLQGKTYVEKCLKEHFNMEDIAMKELTPQFIHDFSVYLSVERGLRGGTVWLACQQLKGVVTRAYQRGVLTWNPFAVLALNKGMPIESLSRLLGHTNITTTQIYAKITMHKLEEDMNRLAEKLNI